jgi:chromate transport protein ChrA
MSKNNKLAQNKLVSRRWLTVILCFALFFTSLLLKAWEFIPVLSILASGITAWLGVSTFFKEKNYTKTNDSEGV